MNTSSRTCRSSSDPSSRNVFEGGFVPGRCQSSILTGMNLKIADLWNWHGRLGRGAYLLWGVLLFAVKFNLDRFVFGRVLQTDWDISVYLQWNFPSPAVLPADLSSDQRVLLIVTTIPFLWAGVILTIQRLRAARLPPLLACLFVVPVLKWFLFIVACVVPTRESPQFPPPLMHDVSVSSSKVLTHSKWRSAIVAVISVGFLSACVVAVGAQWLSNYGWGLFVGIPFLTGFVAAVLHGNRIGRNSRECVEVACLAVTFAGLCLLAFALEGIVCLIMAAPLAYPLAVIGGLAGCAAQPAKWHSGGVHLHCAAILSLPFLVGVEALNPRSAHLIEVSTSVDIDADVQTVWKHVVSFSELPVPQEWLFKAGIAYPIRAEIQGAGVGAVRHCVFSTGPFVEPITVWDEPRLLAFSVTSNPAPMQEWTPYSAIHPPHLKGFLVSERGQFRLTPIEGGQTRLVGTTWYRHGLWPDTYWQWWSDHIIHTIHRRVLLHIRNLSESEI